MYTRKIDERFFRSGGWSTAATKGSASHKVRKRQHCEPSRACSDKQLINYAQIRQHGRQRVRQGIGKDKGQVRPDDVLFLPFPPSRALLSSCIINERFHIMCTSVFLVACCDDRVYSRLNKHRKWRLPALTRSTSAHASVGTRVHKYVPASGSPSRVTITSLACAVDYTRV